MRKFLDTKAGATFFEELPNLTINPRKDCVEIIFKLKPGLYAIINLRRFGKDEIMLFANWGNYFMRLQNPEAQLPRIKKTCPTLYAVLMGEDKDNVNQLRHKDAKNYETGLGVICKVDGEAPIFSLLNNDILDKVNMLVNKNVDIYNELNTNPPFPAWKDGLRDLWNYFFCRFPVNCLESKKIIMDTLTIAFDDRNLVSAISDRSNHIIDSLRQY